MFSTNVDYKFQVVSTGPLTNVTLYVPLPVKNGTPVAGTFVLTKQYFSQENISLDFVRFPPGMDPNWTSPVPGETPLFLKIHADRFYPNKTNNIEYSFFYENKTALDSPLAFPDTIYPFDNQSVFLQKINFSQALPEVTASKNPDLIVYRDVDVNQKVMLYADYSASPSTWVNIYSQVLVLNKWDEHGDTRDNFYADSYTWFHTGDSQGWQVAKGLFIRASGDYPNLTSPAWQMVLDRDAGKNR
ncbi:MAG: hypothetical protein CVV30_04870 [Methanomicrobiales archaeon HGW-Methanomicrobiales-1]|jgi:hypothetical protein|nr:MAG: hypothetical protein CVV30_04870 [Methanomicrobiales archaeon HGW-Methanomicrobiales-1]